VLVGGERGSRLGAVEHWSQLRGHVWATHSKDGCSTCAAA
jgi:hypothetical protein